ncbi:MAG: hypothetical protein R2694_03165 [Ilumatobacteraceae bacterium]
MGMPHAAGSPTRQIGVYVAAISTKIIEWSMRCMICCTRSLRARRW